METSYLLLARMNTVNMIPGGRTSHFHTLTAYCIHGNIYIWARMTLRVVLRNIWAERPTGNYSNASKTWLYSHSRCSADWQGRPVITGLAVWSQPPPAPMTKCPRARRWTLNCSRWSDQGLACWFASESHKACYIKVYNNNNYSLGSSS